MTTRRSQGAQANLNGKIFERVLEPTFIEHGFEIMKERDWLNAGAPEKNIVIKQMSYTTIYGHKGKTEFVVIPVPGRRIRIECKWQESAGSVDEKFPYMLANAVEAYPEKEIILIVDGDGYKAGARKWLADSIEHNWGNYKALGKEIKLFRINDFLRWVNKNF